MIQPNATFTYESSGLPQHTAYAFWNREAAVDRREIVFGPFSGGGWAPGTGQAVQAIDPNPGSLVYRLWERGYIIVTAGYTVDNPITIGQGRFRPNQWDFGSTGRLMLNTGKLHWHCSEMDLVKLIQRTRRVIQSYCAEAAVEGGTGGIIGRSAGSVAPLLVAMMPMEVENGLGEVATPTRVKWVFCQQAIASLAAPKDNLPSYHLVQSDGTVANTFGEATANSKQKCSPLYYAEQVAHLHAGTQAAVFLNNTDPAVSTGSLTYSGFQNVLNGTQLHSQDHVLALKAALQRTPFHKQNSVFDTEMEGSRLVDAAIRWIDSLS